MREGWTAWFAYALAIAVLTAALVTGIFGWIGKAKNEVISKLEKERPALMERIDQLEEALRSSGVAVPAPTSGSPPDRARRPTRNRTPQAPAPPPPSPAPSPAPTPAPSPSPSPSPSCLIPLIGQCLAEG
ncbi:MAG: hypothetical protein ACRDHO_06290 [Actinomycetota bacterium]